MHATEGQDLAAAYRTMRGGLPVYTRMPQLEDAQEGPRAFIEKRLPDGAGVEAQAMQTRRRSASHIGNVRKAYASTLPSIGLQPVGCTA